MSVERRDALIRILGVVSLTIGGHRVDAGRRWMAGFLVDHAHGHGAHATTPAFGGDPQELLLASPTLEQLQLWKTLLVGDLHDPFAIRRPARMKAVVFPERHLVRLTAFSRKGKEVDVLIAQMRAVDDPLAVRRPVRTRPVKSLLLVNESRLP